MVEKLVFNENIFLKDWPWEEIHICGALDKTDNILPSNDRSYANPVLYSNSELLKKTTETMLEKTKDSLYELEQKILKYQPEKKDALLKMASGKGRWHISRLRSAAEFKKVSEMLGSEEYKNSIKTAEVVSADFDDSIKYTGLVMVAQGLIKMLNENTFVPEVVGEHFHEIYKKIILN